MAKKITLPMKRYFLSIKYILNVVPGAGERETRKVEPKFIFLEPVPKKYTKRLYDTLLIITMVGFELNPGVFKSP